MITNTTQDWSEGATVKVGFLSLVVRAVMPNHQGGPEKYMLTSLDSRKLYQFIPHQGLTRVS